VRVRKELGLCSEHPFVIMGNMSIRASTKRIAKLAISLFCYIARGLSRLALQLAGRSPDRKLVILYYHGIPLAYRSNFARQMEAIQRGAQVLPASYRGSLPLGKANVAITFDDAYVSVAENALAVLASRGFHSTIFVPVDSLGSPPTWPMEYGSPDSYETIMSAEQIANLPSLLVAVGSHTCTHPRLSRIDPRDARKEIEGSRAKLQKLTAQDIRLLAFPYGDHDDSIIDLCRTAGYEYAFSTTPTPIDTTSSDFIRGRVKVDPSDWPLEFFLKYNGAYSWASHVSLLKRRLRNRNQYQEVRSCRQSISEKQPKGP
jgi:peptidoglycan/xylan/chitin deacetylase (PgdA/CDA1 family)